MKTIEQYFQVYTVQGGSNFEVRDETLVCHHSNESFSKFHVVLVFMLYKVVLTFNACDHSNERY